jgi:hypothetical protein
MVNHCGGRIIKNNQRRPKRGGFFFLKGVPMKDSTGTPKTLDEAIEHAICIGPLYEVKNRSYFVLKDFMAQKFGVAYLGASPETLEVLQDLFKQLTQRAG